MDELKEMLRSLKENQDRINSVESWVSEIDDEVKKLWKSLHKIETNMQSTMSDINKNIALIDNKLDNKVELMNSKLDTIKTIVELKEQYQKETADTKDKIKSEAQQGFKSDYRFWIMVALAVVSFISGLLINIGRL